MPWFADRKVMLEFAVLQLRIAISRNPTAEMDMSEATVHRSLGYKRMRAFYRGLRPIKRAQWIKQLQAQVVGVREVMALAAKTGEPLSLADITIEVIDAETRQRVPDAPTLQAADEDEPT